MASSPFNPLLSSTDNLGPAILASVWTETAVGTLVVLLRIFVRMRYLHHLKPDDWLMIGSLVLAILVSIMNTEAVHWGLGHHQQYLGPDQVAKSIMWDLIAQPVVLMGQSIARLSVVYLLTSILSPQQRIRRALLYGMGYSQLAVNIASGIYIYAQCRPISALWSPGTGTCNSPIIQEILGYCVGAINGFNDLFLALFPISMVYNLRLKLRVKVSLCIIMGLGVFAMVATIVKTVQLSALGQSDDYTYATADLIIWYELETWAVIIAASIPTLKPLFSSSAEKTHRSNANNYSTSKRSWPPHTASRTRTGALTAKAAAQGHSLSTYLGRSDTKASAASRDCLPLVDVVRSNEKVAR